MGRQKQHLLSYALLLIFAINSVSSNETTTVQNNAETTTEKLIEVYQEHKIDINNTIAEVQRILALDPNLPRLSREEIMVLLDNITKTDEQLLKQNKTTEEANRDQRAIMYVMPYNPQNYSNIQELYTKAPVVHIVANSSDPNLSTLRPIRTRLPTFRTTTTTSSPRDDLIEEDISDVQIKMNSETGVQGTTTEKVHITQNISEIMESQTEFTTTTKLPEIVLPTKITKMYENIPKPIISFTTTNEPIEFTTTKRPYIQRGSIRYPNHRYPEDMKPEPFTTRAPESALKIMEAPKLNEKSKRKEEKHPQYKPGIVEDEVIKIPAQVHKRRRPYPQIPVTTTTTERVFKVTPTPSKTTEFDFVYFKEATTKKSPVDDNFDFVHFKDEIDSNVAVPETNGNEAPDFGFSNNFKEIIDNIDLSQSETKKNPNGKYSSSYVETRLKKKPSTPPPMRENVKDILASIGLFPAPSTTTTTKPDWSAGAEGLDPEMKELLMTFGLIPNPNDNGNKAVRFADDFSDPEPSKPMVTKESYVNFKPLPDSAPSRQDMQQFLSKFGLVGENHRDQKSIKNEEKPKPNPTKHQELQSLPEIDEDLLPEGMKDVLEDIGLMQRKKAGQKVKQHISNPTEEASKEELQKLELLLATIKQLEKLNGTQISQADLDALDLKNIQKLSDSINNSTSKDIKQLSEQEPDFLNPVTVEDLQNLLQANEKFKRQNNASSNTASASDLAASFPGMTDTNSTSSIAEAPIPQPRRNGLYFLLDWNSFLEVGDDDRTKVNIRFAPKVGDPARFVPVGP
ncbi:uncharacterized protein LOC123299002 [Chrysoperla carnea]|uniref:uncharacterized protein LOC123299002 n=1 Tax=Chrysoperla carnea TaxID=189513 RepID=UPI001D07A4DA|nr:uncharacterized protein LOC123299002 [Chrysoperla carnea]